MHKVIEIGIGVCLGAIMTMISLWAFTAIAQFVCGNRYFTPSEHIVKKRLMERLLKDGKKEVAKEVTEVKLAEEIVIV